MKYVDYELDAKMQSAIINYFTKDQKYYYIYMSKKAVDSQEVIEIDGKVVDQHLLGVKYLDKGVKVEEIQQEDGIILYKADFYYNDDYYLFAGELEKEEFDEIIKKIMF